MFFAAVLVHVSISFSIDPYFALWSDLSLLYLALILPQAAASVQFCVQAQVFAYSKFNLCLYCSTSGFFTHNNLSLAPADLS